MYDEVNEVGCGYRKVRIGDSWTCIDSNGNEVNLLSSGKEKENSFNLLRAADATIYQGFDTASTVSEDNISKMWTSTPFYWVGFYLGGINYQSGDRNTDNSSKSYTKSLRSKYAETGFKMAYIYVGRTDGVSTLTKPSSNLTTAASEGKNDAMEASRFARSIEVPTLSVIYLDIEGGNLHNDATIEYIKSWVKEINANTVYYAGIYCSNGTNSEVAKQIYDAISGKANIWIAKWQTDSGKSYNESTGTSFTTSATSPALINSPDPTASYEKATMRQYAGNVYVKYNNFSVMVDLDTSTQKDPSLKNWL